MNFRTILKDILIVIGFSIVLTIFITYPGFSQDTTKTKGDKKVKITAKIIQDNNGKKQEFDTTINLDRNLKPGEEQELMKSFELKFKDLGDQMKNLQVEISDMDLPDFPTPPEPPQPLIEEFNDDNAPEILNEENNRMFGGRGESLNDILGDIPMDRVKSYSIKDTKDGKKIVIELKNGPMIEHHRDVVII